MKASLRLWVSASRPKTLSAAVAPVVLATAIAFRDGYFNFLIAGLSLMGAVCIQIGTNLANDYYDYVRGADTPERKGPVRLSAQGLIEPVRIKYAFMLMFVLAVLSGTYLVYQGGWPILIVGVLSILSGYLYTGGPFPLAYAGLGDIFVFVFFGPVAVGATYYLYAGTLPIYVLLSGLASGALSTAILIVNNIRDRKEDKASGKKTLCVRFGPVFSKIEYMSLIVGATLIPFIIYFKYAEHPFILATCGVLYTGKKTFYAVLYLEGEHLNQALEQTARLLLLFSILFSAGWLL